MNDPVVTTAATPVPATATPTAPAPIAASPAPSRPEKGGKPRFGRKQGNAPVTPKPVVKS